MTNNLPEKRAITCFLESDGKILLLRRSQQAGNYQERWAGVSGYVETTPDEQAMTEIREETKWISPKDIADFATVPRLKETLDSVYPA